MMTIFLHPPSSMLVFIMMIVFLWSICLYLYSAAIFICQRRNDLAHLKIKRTTPLQYYTTITSRCIRRQATERLPLAGSPAGRRSVTSSRVATKSPRKIPIGQAFYSDRALLVFLLRSFIIKKTRAYEVMQKRAVIPVCYGDCQFLSAS